MKHLLLSVLTVPTNLLNQITLFFLLASLAGGSLGDSELGESLALDSSKSVLKIYLDADRSRHYQSARAIEMGIKTAFDEIDNQIQGYDIEFVALDHRANTARNKLNMKRAFSDPEALLVVAGMHSPPLIKNRTYINENKMLTLVPWAAGGPITRHPSEDNWVFRLSVDDSNAGVVLADFALNSRQCKAPRLLLEQTPWGESNRKTISRELSNAGITVGDVNWFNWGTSVENFRIKLRGIAESGADCILYVGNSSDATELINAMTTVELEKPISLVSHWGITGGNFQQKITYDKRETVDLSFIQTCFSFVSSEPTEQSEQVFERAKSLFLELTDKNSLQAPVGFIHAYDIGLLLRQALSQFELTGDMAENRQQLKDAFENLNKPVNGLVKQYDRPYSVFSESNIDAHEALGVSDYCMAKYGQDNEIHLIK